MHDFAMCEQQNGATVDSDQVYLPWQSEFFSCTVGYRETTTEREAGCAGDLMAQPFRMFKSSLPRGPFVHD